MPPSPVSSPLEGSALIGIAQLRIRWFAHANRRSTCSRLTVNRGLFLTSVSVESAIGEGLGGFFSAHDIKESSHDNIVT